MTTNGKGNFTGKVAFVTGAGAPTFVPWQFIHHRPLQPDVGPLAQRVFVHHSPSREMSRFTSPVSSSHWKPRWPGSVNGSSKSAT